MHDPTDDPLLDARLRDVPVPGALLGGLRAIAELSDGELDWQLADVALPKGLLHRLRQIVSDEELDDRLREVPLPGLVVVRARTIPRGRGRSPAGRFALAASLLIALSLGYWSSWAGVVLALRPEPAAVTTLTVMDEGPLDLVSQPAEFALAEVAADETPSDWRPAGGVPEGLMLMALERPSPGPAGMLFAEMGHDWDPAENWMRLRWPLLGYSRPELDTLPELELVDLPAPQGLRLPLTPDFDREFLYSRGAQPPVMVASESAANRVVVPLCTQTDSFANLRRALDRGGLIPPEELRPEHFLAAVDYRLPPAEPGQVALRAAGGPSVFNPGSAGLLQIAVKAGPVEAARPAATHLTVALDLSASMKWDRRLDRAREGLQRALSQLGAQDRFSLLVAGEQPFLLVSEARTDDLPAIFERLDALRAGGGCDLVESLQQAIVATLDTAWAAPAARRLVLITDSGSTLRQESLSGLQRMLREASQRPFRLDILDLSDEDSGSEAAAALAALAEAGGGGLRAVGSTEQIRWSLVEILCGAPVLVAADAQLEVQFNPQAVAAYRLIGHEAQGSGGLMPGEPRADLHAGEEATALFELWLYPNEEDDVAVARLRWTDPATGEVRRVEAQRISRTQFASSFEGSAVWLQAAAVAAEAAEVLRQGFNFSVAGSAVYRFEPKPRDLDHVLEVVRRANPQLQQRADFLQLVRVLQAADRAVGERPAALAKSGSRAIVAGRWREVRN